MVVKQPALDYTSQKEVEIKGTNNPYKDSPHKRIFSAFYIKKKLCPIGETGRRVSRQKYRFYKDVGSIPTTLQIIEDRSV